MIRNVIPLILFLTGAVLLQAAAPSFRLETGEAKLKGVSFRYLVHRPTGSALDDTVEASPLIVAKTSALRKLQLSLDYDGEKGILAFADVNLRLRGPLVVFVDERTMTAVLLHDNWLELEQKAGGLKEAMRSLLDVNWERLRLAQKP